MGKIERFEDLKCWQQARKVVNLVYDVCDTEKIFRDFTTKDQIKRAALSSMNNIAEGFGRFSNKEFIRFLEISESSAMETRSMLYILIDRKYIDQKKFDEIYNEVIDLTNQVIGFIKYLRDQGDNSSKKHKPKD
jgi:four helix bundle protein